MSRRSKFLLICLAVGLVLFAVVAIWSMTYLSTWIVPSSPFLGEKTARRLADEKLDAYCKREGLGLEVFSLTDISRQDIFSPWAVSYVSSTAPRHEVCIIVISRLHVETTRLVE